MATWTRRSIGGALVALGVVVLLASAGCSSEADTGGIATIADAEEFDRIVLKADKPVLVDFFADGCPPCRRLAPILHELAEEYKDRAVFVKVNCGESRGLMEQYGVGAFPTVMIFHQGKPGVPLVGIKSAGVYRQAIDSKLAKGT